MALDRDELSARCLVALLSRGGYVGDAEAQRLGAVVAVGCADALLSALVPVAPASGAPASEPRRMRGAVISAKPDGHVWMVVVDGEGFNKLRLLTLDSQIDALGHTMPSDEFVRWATREECEKHRIDYVARPLPGAPVAAPSCPEWVNGGVYLHEPRVRRVLRWEGDRPVVGSVMALGDPVREDLPRVLDYGTWTPCAAPSPSPAPAATPAAYVPKVGDVVGIDGGNDYGETRVVTAVGARVTYARLNYAGKMLCDHTMDVSRLTYLRPATAAERAAAGLPVDESATKPVDREGLRVALRVTEAVFNANDRSVTPDDCERGQAIYCAALNAVGYDKTWSARSVSSFIDHLKAKLARGGAS